MADDEVKNEEATEEAAAPAEEAAAPADDTATDAPAEDAGEEVEVPAEFKDLIEKIESMTVLELHQLVKVLEKKFGVSAQAVAVAAPGAAAGGDAGEEQDAFTVTLKDAGSQKIQVIKAVKELLGLGLKEAKDMVDGAPAELKKDVKKDEAESIKAKIEEAGGTVEIA